MLNRIIALGIFVLSLANVSAQESKIGFSVCSDKTQIGLNDGNAAILVNKINQILARNNAGATATSSILFSIRPELVCIQSDVVNTGVRQVYVERGELTLYATNRADGNIFESVAISLEGSDISKDNAIRKMINRINISDVRITRFIRSAQSRIEEYYIDITPKLIIKAETLAKQKKFDEAIILLSTIPETVDNYSTVSELMVSYYTAKLDYSAEREINRVETLLVKGEIDSALDILTSIDPLSTHSASAKKMVAAIKSDMEKQRADEAAQRAAAMELEMEKAQREFDNSVRLEEMRLKAANSYAESSITDNQLVDTLCGSVLGSFGDAIVGIITK